MSQGLSPTMQRRQLGGELRRLRQAAGLTLEAVRKELYFSESKISRIETGRMGAATDDIGRMLELYRVGPEQRAALLKAAEDARRRSWWQAYGDTTIVPLVGLEAAAQRISQYENMTIPALLQTADYARAVIAAERPDYSSERIARLVELRMNRQALLGVDDPPLLSVVLEECVLRRPVGGRMVMWEQLHRLVQAAMLSNVTVQILPITVGEHPGMKGAFTVYRFAEAGASDVVYLEHGGGDHYIESAEQTSQYVDAFDEIRGQALNPEHSIAFATKIVKEL